MNLKLRIPVPPKSLERDVNQPGMLDMSKSEVLSDLDDSWMRIPPFELFLLFFLLLFLLFFLFFFFFSFLFNW